MAADVTADGGLKPPGEQESELSRQEARAAEGSRRAGEGQRLSGRILPCLFQLLGAPGVRWLMTDGVPPISASIPRTAVFPLCLCLCPYFPLHISTATTSDPHPPQLQSNLISACLHCTEQTLLPNKVPFTGTSGWDLSISLRGTQSNP